MNNLIKLIKRDEVGYVLEAAKFLVLLGAVVHVGHRVHTLETQGCTSYYTEFNGLEDADAAKFYNKSEYKDFKQGSSLEYEGEIEDKTNFTNFKYGLNKTEPND